MTAKGNNPVKKVARTFFPPKPLDKSFGLPYYFKYDETFFQETIK
jgi:hypothetical protein